MKFQLDDDFDCDTVWDIKEKVPYIFQLEPYNWTYLLWFRTLGGLALSAHRPLRLWSLTGGWYHFRSCLGWRLHCFLTKPPDERSSFGRYCNWIFLVTGGWNCKNASLLAVNVVDRVQNIYSFRFERAASWVVVLVLRSNAYTNAYSDCCDGQANHAKLDEFWVWHGVFRLKLMYS